VEIFKGKEVFWVEGKQTKVLGNARAVAFAVSRQNKK